MVTGANTGLGLACVGALAARGADVVLAVRDPAKGERARAGLLSQQQDRSDNPAPGPEPGSVEQGRDWSARLTVARLDLADLGSVAEFAGQQVAAGPLDILVNNAGLMVVPTRQLTADGFEVQMGVNHLGHFALTAQLLPALSRARRGRVVSVTSIAHRLTGPLDPRLNLVGAYHSFSSYAQSKLACALFGLELDRRLRATGSPVSSVVAHPGYVATHLFDRQARPSLSQRVNSLLTPVFAAGPRAGARSEVRAAVDPSLSGGELIGPRFLVRGAPVREVPARNALDRGSASLLWDLSGSLTEIDFGL